VVEKQLRGKVRALLMVLAARLGHTCSRRNETQDASVFTQYLSLRGGLRDHAGGDPNLRILGEGVLPPCASFLALSDKWVGLHMTLSCT
jgi:hypothetical protein